MHIETLAVHAGRRADAATGAIAPPIHLSTTFERAPDGEYPLGFSYSREGNPNRRRLEECLAALEGGTEALAFASGMAAANALIQGLEPGDHIVAPDDVYYGLRKVIGEVFGKWKLEASYVDMTDLNAVNAAMRANTRLVWLETPSNPLLKITDLSAIAAIARRANAISVCDGTFATPVLQRPLDLGIDMVVHSTTKYIGGHSDVVGGALTTKFQNYLFERARKSQQTGGAVPSPFDCWLILRGADTLPCRVRAQAETAGRIAAFLKSHQAVEAVHYPGLAGHPGHAIAARQMTAFGAMVSMQLCGGRERAMQVAARVQVFTRATSLGGTHSLIEHRASVEGPNTRTPQNLLRISVGLENAEDLIGDLAQALG
jgi:cystathionine gamma-synthase